MAKFANDAVMDAAFDEIIDNATRMTACSQQPTTYAEGNATYALAQVTIDSSDFTKADGDTSGRKVTVAAKPGVDVSTTGSATHVALLDVSGSRLLYVTTLPTTDVAAGSTVDIEAWGIEIADPS